MWYDNDYLWVCFDFFGRIDHNFKAALFLRDLNDSYSSPHPGFSFQLSVQSDVLHFDDTITLNVCRKDFSDITVCGVPLLEALNLDAVNKWRRDCHRLYTDGDGKRVYDYEELMGFPGVDGRLVLVDLTTHMPTRFGGFYLRSRFLLRAGQSLPFSDLRYTNTEGYEELTKLFGEDSVKSYTLKELSVAAEALGLKMPWTLATEASSVTLTATAMDEVQRVLRRQGSVYDGVPTRRDRDAVELERRIRSLQGGADWSCSRNGSGYGLGDLPTFSFLNVDGNDASEKHLYQIDSRLYKFDRALCWFGDEDSLVEYFDSLSLYDLLALYGMVVGTNDDLLHTGIFLEGPLGDWCRSMIRNTLFYMTFACVAGTEYILPDSVLHGSDGNRHEWVVYPTSMGYAVYVHDLIGYTQNPNLFDGFVLDDGSRHSVHFWGCIGDIFGEVSSYADDLVLDMGIDCLREVELTSDYAQFVEFCEREDLFGRWTKDKFAEFKSTWQAQIGGSVHWNLYNGQLQTKALGDLCHYYTGNPKFLSGCDVSLGFDDDDFLDAVRITGYDTEGYDWEVSFFSDGGWHFIFYTDFLNLLIKRGFKVGDKVHTSRLIIIIDKSCTDAVFDGIFKLLGGDVDKYRGYRETGVYRSVTTGYGRHEKTLAKLLILPFDLKMVLSAWDNTDPNLSLGETLSAMGSRLAYVDWAGFVSPLCLGEISVDCCFKCGDEYYIRTDYYGVVRHENDDTFIWVCRGTRDEEESVFGDQIKRHYVSGTLKGMKRSKLVSLCSEED